MLLQPIADRLRLVVTDFKKVAGAADFASAEADLITTPSGYVIPLADTAQPNVLLGYSAEQHVIERCGICLAVTNARDVRGDAVNAPLENLRKKVIQALLGFQAQADYDPIQYGGGQILKLDVTTLWWRVDFITGYYERKI